MMVKDRAAFVTGGAGRIGRVVAETLRREGAKVFVADYNAVRLTEVTVALGMPGTAGDVSKPEDVARMVEEAEYAIGPIDILVNAHGIFPNRPLMEMTAETWDAPFVVNVRGSMLMCQALAKRWIERGTKGAIVNLSSGASRSARAGGSHYAGSKAALNMMTEVLAIELGPHGIRINNVLPGLIMDQVLTEEAPDVHPYVNQMLRGTPLGRTGAPSDVAEAVVFLASNRAPWITGAMLEVTGGSHCGRTHVPLSGNLR